MTTDELFTIFLRHQHTGNHPDAQKIKVLINPTIILISEDGSKFILGVDNDGVLTTTKIS